MRIYAFEFRLPFSTDEVPRQILDTNKNKNVAPFCWFKPLISTTSVGVRITVHSRNVTTVVTCGNRAFVAER